MPHGVTVEFILTLTSSFLVGQMTLLSALGDKQLGSAKYMHAVLHALDCLYGNLREIGHSIFKSIFQTAKLIYWYPIRIDSNYKGFS